jgi:hypothetical protein
MQWVALNVPLDAIRNIVVCLHVLVGHLHLVVSPKRANGRWQHKNKHEACDAHDSGSLCNPIGCFEHKVGARVIATQLGILQDGGHSIERGFGVVLGGNLIAQRRVFFHVVIKLVVLALFEEPGLVLAEISDACVFVLVFMGHRANDCSEPKQSHYCGEDGAQRESLVHRRHGLGLLELLVECFGLR